VFPDHGDAELTDSGDAEHDEHAEHDEPELPELDAASQTSFTRPPPRHGLGAPARGRRVRLRVVAVTGVVAAGLALLAFVVTLAPVRTVLRQSFTRIPSPYTEMYFSGAPTVSGIDLIAPVTVINHATRSDSFELRIWVVDAAGATDASTSMTVTPKHGEAKTVVEVSVQLPANGQVLWVALVGQTQTLHYRFAGAALPAQPASTSTPVARSTAGR
jgi:hypothetical protein